jgi:glucose/arabinose dehydrogenase
VALSRLVGALALLLFVSVAVAQPRSMPLDTIRLPPGFAIELVARVDNARQMVLGPKGTLFVGSMQAGKVYAVRLRPGAPAEVLTIASGLSLPAGVAFQGGALYVSSVNRVLRLDDVENHLADPPKPVVVTDRLPKDRHHGWKVLGFGPDGKLYVPVGAPCNICEPDADRYANIMRMNADGSGLETFARGVRNTVGFDWDPRTRDMWFTDNGRDWLGDDSPPDELNHAPRAGMHFGFPYCHGGTISDPEFGRRRPCSDFTPPAQNLGPHVAALGMRFYSGEQFPAQYRNQILIAEHGSWNRSRKIGYRVSLVRLEDGKAVAYEPFATGWLQGGDAWGRPADVLVMPDGSLLVSDDFAGAIYRITYRG